MLKRDGRRVRFGAGCEIRSGRWRSVYGGVITTRSALVDVDHIVPLAHAWQSAARRWTPRRRERFANGRRELIAVSQTANSAKGDSPPEQWKPPRRAVWCLYARWWIDIKTRYRLTTTRREQRALTAMLHTCAPRLSALASATAASPFGRRLAERGFELAWNSRPPGNPRRRVFESHGAPQLLPAGAQPDDWSGS